MTQARDVIRFEKISKAHEGRNALEGVSLAVREGEFLAVVGPSGAGKTTLLRLINRLTEASQGVVRVEGEDVRAVDAIALRRRIGYVFQGIGLFPHMTVAENIGITPRLLGWDAPRIAARVEELIRLVRLDPAVHRARRPAARAALRPAPGCDRASPARSTGQGIRNKSGSGSRRCRCRRTPDRHRRPDRCWTPRGCHPDRCRWRHRVVARLEAASAEAPGQLGT